MYKRGKWKKKKLCYNRSHEPLMVNKLNCIHIFKNPKTSVLYINKYMVSNYRNPCQFLCVRVSLRNEWELICWVCFFFYCPFNHTFDRRRNVFGSTNCIRVEVVCLYACMCHLYHTQKHAHTHKVYIKKWTFRPCKIQYAKQSNGHPTIHI